jgi:hypothetical protein
VRPYFGKKERKNLNEEASKMLSSLGYNNELFVKEIIGNCIGIIHQFCFDRPQLYSSNMVLKALYPEHEFCTYEDDILTHYAMDTSNVFRLLDCYFSPPFFEDNPMPENSDKDPCTLFYEVLSSLPANAIAGHQVLIQSCPNQDGLRKIIARLIALKSELGQMVNLSDFLPGWNFSPRLETHRNQCAKTDPSQHLFAYRNRVFLFARKSDANEIVRCLHAAIQDGNTKSLPNGTMSMPLRGTITRCEK